MAKSQQDDRRSVKNDEIKGVDNLDNFQSRDDDLGFPGGNARGRSPAQTARYVASEFLKGTSAGMIRGVHTELARKLPHTAAALSDVQQTWDDLGQLRQDFARSVRPSINIFKQMTKQALPAVKSFVPNAVYSKIDELLTPIHEAGSSDARAAAAAGQAADIKNAMLEVFQQREEADRIMDAQKDSKGFVDMALQAERHKESLNVLSGIRSATMFSAAFVKGTYTAYLKKSLELKYLHYFAAKDTLSTVQFMSKMLETKLEEIKHNTGLPDYTKITLSERVKEHMWGAGTKRVADYLGSFRTKLISNIKANVIGTAEMALSAVAQMLQMMGDMGGDMTGAVSNMTGDLAGQAGGGGLGRYLFKFIQPMSKDLEGWARGLKTRTIVGMKNWARDKQYGGGIMGLLAGLIPTLTARTTIKNTMMDNPTGPAIFDKAVRMSIVEVIPGYLAKQTKYLTDIARRLKAEGPDGGAEELVYDPKKRDFITASAYRSSVKAQAFETTAAASKKAIATGQLEAARAANATNISEAAVTIKALRPYLDTIWQNHANEVMRIDYNKLVKLADQGDAYFDETGYIKIAFDDVPKKLWQRIAQYIVKSLTRGGMPDKAAIHNLDNTIDLLITDDKYKEILPMHAEHFGNRRHLTEMFNRDTSGDITEGVSNRYITRNLTSKDRNASDVETDRVKERELAETLRSREDMQKFIDGLKKGQLNTSHGQIAQDFISKFNLKDKHSAVAMALVQAVHDSPEALQAFVTKLSTLKGSDLTDAADNVIRLANEKQKKLQAIERAKEDAAYGVERNETEDAGVNELEQTLADALGNYEGPTARADHTPEGSRASWRGGLRKFGKGKGPNPGFIANKPMYVAESGSEAVIPVAQLVKMIKDTVKIAVKGTELKFTATIQDLAATAKAILGEIQKGSAVYQVSPAGGPPEGTMHYTLREFSANFSRHSELMDARLANLTAILEGKSFNGINFPGRGSLGRLGKAVKKFVTAPIDIAYHVVVKYPAEEGYIDVYRKSDMHLLLTASDQKSGVILSATGKQVKVTADIAGAVVTMDGTKTLISLDDVAAGLVDVYGNPINRTSIRGLLGKLAMTTVTNVGRGLLAAVEFAGTFTTEAYKLGKSAITKYPAEEGYIDIYLNGRITPGNPLLSAKSQEEGVFFGNNKRVKVSADIVEPVFKQGSATAVITVEDLKIGLVDGYGNPISRKSLRGWVEDVAVGGALAAGGAVKVAGRLAGGIIMGAGRLGANMVGAGVDAMNETAAEKGYIDVYRKNEVRPGDPILSVRQQEHGVYLIRKKNKLQCSADIIEPIIDIDNKLLVTQADIEHGLVDENNKDIVPTSRRIGKALGSTIKGTLKLTGQAIGGMFTVIKNLVEKGPLAMLQNTLKTGWKGLKWGFEKGKDVFDSLWNITVNKDRYKPITTRMDRMIELLSFIEKNVRRTKVAGDIDNDGRREGSYEDWTAERKAAQAGKFNLFQKGSTLAGKVGGAAVGVMPGAPGSEGGGLHLFDKAMSGLDVALEYLLWKRMGKTAAGKAAVAGGEAAVATGGGWLARNLGKTRAGTYVLNKAQSVGNAAKATKTYLQWKQPMYIKGLQKAPANLRQQVISGSKWAYGGAKGMWSGLKGAAYAGGLGAGAAGAAGATGMTGGPPPIPQFPPALPGSPEAKAFANSARLAQEAESAAMAGNAAKAYKLNGAAAEATRVAQGMQEARIAGLLGRKPAAAAMVSGAALAAKTGWLGRAGSMLGGGLKFASKAMLPLQMLHGGYKAVKTFGQNEAGFNDSMDEQVDDAHKILRFGKKGSWWAKAQALPIPGIASVGKMTTKIAGSIRLGRKLIDEQDTDEARQDMETGRQELANKLFKEIYDEEIKKGTDPKQATKIAKQKSASRAMKEYKHVYKRHWNMQSVIAHPLEAAAATGGWMKDKAVAGVKTAANWVGLPIAVKKVKEAWAGVSKYWGEVTDSLADVLVTAGQWKDKALDAAKKAVKAASKWVAETAVGKAASSAWGGVKSAGRWVAGKWEQLTGDAEEFSEDYQLKLKAITELYTNVKWNHPYKKQRGELALSQLKNKPALSQLNTLQREFYELRQMPKERADALMKIKGMPAAAPAAGVDGKPVNVPKPGDANYEAYKASVEAIDDRGRIGKKENADLLNNSPTLAGAAVAASVGSPGETGPTGVTPSAPPALPGNAVPTAVADTATTPVDVGNDESVKAMMWATHPEFKPEDGWILVRSANGKGWTFKRSVSMTSGDPEMAKLMRSGAADVNTKQAKMQKISALRREAYEASKKGDFKKVAEIDAQIAALEKEPVATKAPASGGSASTGSGSATTAIPVIAMTPKATAPASASAPVKPSIVPVTDKDMDFEGGPRTLANCILAVGYLQLYLDTHQNLKDRDLYIRVLPNLSSSVASVLQDTKHGEPSVVEYAYSRVPATARQIVGFGRTIDMALGRVLLDIIKTGTVPAVEPEKTTAPTTEAQAAATKAPAAQSAITTVTPQNETPTSGGVAQPSMFPDAAITKVGNGSVNIVGIPFPGNKQTLSRCLAAIGYLEGVIAKDTAGDHTAHTTSLATVKMALASAEKALNGKSASDASAASSKIRIYSQRVCAVAADFSKDVVDTIISIFTTGSGGGISVAAQTSAAAPTTPDEFDLDDDDTSTTAVAPPTSTTVPAPSATTGVVIAPTGVNDPDPVKAAMWAAHPDLRPEDGWTLARSADNTGWTFKRSVTMTSGDPEAAKLMRAGAADVNTAQTKMQKISALRRASYEASSARDFAKSDEIDRQIAELEGSATTAPSGSQAVPVNAMSGTGRGTKVTPVNGMVRGSPIGLNEPNIKTGTTTDAVANGTAATAKAVAESGKQTVGAMSEVNASVADLNQPLKDVAANTAAIPDLVAAMTQTLEFLKKNNGQAPQVAIINAPQNNTMSSGRTPSAGTLDVRRSSQYA